MTTNVYSCPAWNPDDFDGPEDYAAACASCPVHGKEVTA